jgi:hypothetical protein
VALPSRNEYRTLKLTSDQVERYWDELAPVIVPVLGPEVAQDWDLRTNVLQALIQNRMQVWVMYRGNGDEWRRVAIATTRIVTDYLVEQSTLYITSLYGFERIEAEGWQSGFATLREYARGAGCVKMLAHTESDRVMELAEVLDKPAKKHTILTWEV